MTVMIQFVIVVNKPGNIASDVEALGIESLSARSIVLSVLLGTHPPVLSARRLIALAELFGIRAGTVRTALSRMTANGELLADEADYRLGPRLLQRQFQQDEGRAVSATRWDGRWYTAIAAADRRSVAERRAFRSVMVGARLAELRPDIWMRPANVAEPDRPEDVILLTGELAADDPADFAQKLWPLSDIEQRSVQLRTAMERHRASLDAGDASVLPNTFVLSAAVVGFLRTEPQLPIDLQPCEWSPPGLRADYNAFEAAFQLLLRSFLRSL